MLDKLLHILAWTVLGFLFSRAYAGNTTSAHSKKTIAKWRQPKRLFWISFISAALYGVSDEIHQYFVPMRSADIFDLFADVIGSLCGAVLGTRWYNDNRQYKEATGGPATPSAPDHIR